MAERTHLLYREGELLERVLEQPAQQIELVLEDALAVQRAHHVDDALELDEVAGLAALLGFAPEPWQGVRLFRAWVHAQRDAVVRDGGVTPHALRNFAAAYAAQYQQATGVRLPAEPPEVVENPPLRRWARPPLGSDDTVPLTSFTVAAQGLDEAVASFLLVGLPAGPESMPLVANLTTGDALLFHGGVGVGERLWLRAGADRTMTAQLETRDVTDRLASIAGLVPGRPWEGAQLERPARAIRLAPGENHLWFLPVATFDGAGLDRVLLALADLALAQGRWDAGRFDRALFYQEPAVRLRMTWVETQPATVELRIPAGTLRRRAPGVGDPGEARAQLGAALDAGVRRLRAAGVRSAARLLDLSELQRSTDALTTVLPLRVRDAGATGADRLPDKGGVFGVTEYGDSTFR